MKQKLEIKDDFNHNIMQNQLGHSNPPPLWCRTGRHKSLLTEGQTQKLNYLFQYLQYQIH